MDPKDEDELQDMMFTALQHNGPSAIRYPRGVGPGTALKEQPQAIEIGRAELIEEDSRTSCDVAIFSLGNMLPEAQRLAAMLRREGQSVAIINARFAKPLDHECVALYANRAEVLVTFEDHVLAGGFGSAVLESLAEQGIDTPVIRIGWPDQFIEHGKVEALRAKYGLTAEAALERVRPHLRHTVTA
jgi:1-deoxy-D-xylulose-5-phosphate synthase